MRKQFETFNIFSEHQIATSSIHIQIQTQKETPTTTRTMNVVVIFPCVSHSVSSNLFSGNMLSVNTEICNLTGYIPIRFKYELQIE